MIRSILFRLVVAAFVGGCLGPASAPAQMIIADLRNDFDTPVTAHTDGETSLGRIPDTIGTGTWDFYGSDLSDPVASGANLMLLTYSTSANSVRMANAYVTPGAFFDLPAWSNGALISPAGSEGSPAADELAVHPGDSNPQFAVAAWTAGYTGSVILSGSFRDLGALGDGVTLDIQLNGTLLFSSGVTSGNTPVIFSQGFTVNSGDVLYFAVGNGGDNNFGADLSALSATVMFAAVPEPSTSALLALGAGFGLLRFALRRRLKEGRST